MQTCNFSSHTSGIIKKTVFKEIDKTVQTTTEETTDDISILDKMGITMEEATDEDVIKIKKAMGDAADKFYKAWKVTNYETEEKYKKFVAERARFQSRLGKMKVKENCLGGSRHVDKFLNVKIDTIRKTN